MTEGTPYRAHRAIVTIPISDLMAELHLDGEFVGIRHNHRSDTLEIGIKHPDLESVPELCEAPGIDRSELTTSALSTPEVDRFTTILQHPATRAAALAAADAVWLDRAKQHVTSSPAEHVAALVDVALDAIRDLLGGQPV